MTRQIAQCITAHITHTREFWIKAKLREYNEIDELETLVLIELFSIF